MKTKLLALFFALPLVVFTQNTDSLKIALQIDSLIQTFRDYMKEGEFEKALQISEQAKNRAFDAFGEKHALYAKANFNLGVTYYFMKKFSEAEESYVQAKNIQLEVIGKEHPDYASTLNNLAVLYETMQQFEKAEVLFLESIEIRGRVLGKKHALYAKSLYNLADLYMKMWRYEKAEIYFQECLAFRELILGKAHPDYVQTINILGVLYWKTGQYDKAEPMYLECKKTREKILGKDHPKYAQIIGNLAVLYSDLRQYDKAELLYLESKDIQEKVLGKAHRDYATSLHNLAALYKTLGQVEKAEDLYLESLDIKENVLGKDHPDYAATLNNLALIYSNTGHYEKAEKMYIEILEIKERILGKDHPDYAGTLNNLAELYFNTEHYEKAQVNYLETLDTWVRTIGKEHPDYILPLKGMAIFNEHVQQFSTTEKYLAEIANLQQSRLSKAVSYLSEKELTNYIKLFQSNGRMILNFALNRKFKSINHVKLSELSYNNALFYKGFLLNSSLEANQLVTNSTESIELNNELKSYRRRLAQQYTKTIKERDTILIAKLDEKANSIEKKLAREVIGYADALQQVDWKDVQNALKKGEAVIEFAHFKVGFPKETGSIMYAALLLLPGNNQPHFIPLFEEKEVRKFFQIEENKGDIYAENINTTYDPDWGNYKNLYDLIWQPLDSFLTDIDRVIYSPSGLLHKVSYAALPASKDTRLMDKYDLQLVTSTREIVIKEESVNSLIASVTLFGDVDYKNKNSDENLSILVDITTNRSILKCELLKTGGTIDPLPGSTREIQFLQNLFTEKGINAIEVKTGKEATETSFKNLGGGELSPSILHVSTHGFFFELSDVNALNCGDSINTSWEAIITSQNPLLRSGLLMSGAEETIQTERNSTTNDDGILTSLEIANVDLSNTQLAVLSACETGLGDIAENEGVYGLQRAFKMAGVDKILMTLWKVDDEITNQFMQSFYTHLLQGATPEKALRLAQHEIREKNPRPFYWAGFILL